MERKNVAKRRNFKRNEKKKMKQKEKNIKENEKMKNLRRRKLTIRSKFFLLWEQTTHPKMSQICSTFTIKVTYTYTFVYKKVG